MMVMVIVMVMTMVAFPARSAYGLPFAFLQPRDARSSFCVFSNFFFRSRQTVKSSRPCKLFPQSVLLLLDCQSNCPPIIAGRFHQSQRSTIHETEARVVAIVIKRMSSSSSVFSFFCRKPLSLLLRLHLLLTHHLERSHVVGELMDLAARLLVLSRRPMLVHLMLPYCPW